MANALFALISHVRTDGQKICSNSEKIFAQRLALLVCEHFALTVPAPSPAHLFHIHFVALAGTDLCVLLQISINAQDVREIFKLFFHPDLGQSARI